MDQSVGEEAPSQSEFVDLIIDLDEINHEFINLILDTLEFYDNYKLCIFVCNRYHLPLRLGRYLVSISTKFSLQASEDTLFSMKTLYNDQVRSKVFDKAFLSSAVLHSLFENINPEFLKLKKRKRGHQLLELPWA